MKVTVAVGDVHWAHSLSAELDSTAGLNQRAHNDDCIWECGADYALQTLCLH